MMCVLLGILCMAGAQRHDGRPAPPAPGVPLSLAEERARRLSDLRYDLHVSVPRDVASPVTGEATIRSRIGRVRFSR